MLGSAYDIIDHCGVARFQFTDFPLGNPCGKPYDKQMQEDIVGRALHLFEAATGPNTVSQSPYEWGTENWRREYMEVRPEDREAMRAAGEARRKDRQERRESGLARES